MTKYICCVAGNSGGHIIPCATFVENNNHNNKYKILFFTTNNSLDQTIIKQLPHIDKHIQLQYASLNNTNKIIPLIIFLIQTAWNFIKSFFIFIKNRPNEIISTGGYVALPICFAGWILRIPITLFELNAEPGKASIALARYATKIYICFKATQPYFQTHKCFIAPYPLRFSKQNYNIKKILSDIHFSQSNITIFVLGGSQGSHFLNTTLSESFLSIKKNYHIQIIHQTGIEHVNLMTAWYRSQKINAHVFAYHHDLAPYYTIADIIICRAGAGTLFETIFFNKKSIVIPLETKTTAHQLYNAYSLAKEHPNLMTIIRQSECNIQQLTTQIQHLIDQPISQVSHMDHMDNN